MHSFMRELRFLSKLKATMKLQMNLGLLLQRRARWSDKKWLSELGITEADGNTTANVCLCWEQLVQIEWERKFWYLYFLTVLTPTGISVADLHKVFFSLLLSKEMFHQPSIMFLKCNKYILTLYILHVETLLPCCKCEQYDREHLNASHTVTFK